MLRRLKAQSTVEYALLVTAALLAIIFGANMVIKPKMKANMDSAGLILDKGTTELNTATGISGGGTP